VPGLDASGLRVAQRFSDLASHRAGEEPATHPDAPVDLPPVDRKASLGERPLPGEDVRVHGVDERSVEIENEGAHW